ncbi:retron Ec67 family RNA-directed DNA polymerase/endonuclease [Marinobacter salarius]|uniref:retron Ec67 family RNA-directed DNA polymerase/endonuclease n=1 Tax=Marinobacter salarius TaxID=1420917 RepID=UPI003BA950C4
MSRLATLKVIKTKKELAEILGIKPSALTYTLYILKPENQYISFQIPKRNGGKRTIDAPIGRIKIIQSKLSKLLLDCIDEINSTKKHTKHKKKTAPTLPKLSHGFARRRSIITNAHMHAGQKNVLNIDLENFFDCFNFGRVRGFFIKNKNFQLHSEVATAIAKIACYNNQLPQGSPCSPVITNLITHSLDIRLARLARKYSCTYSRYADDITFSTRKEVFPVQLMRENLGAYETGKRLRKEIESSGFSINNKKTRIQYKDSRQDVTGLVVNSKPNVKNEYWRTVKAQCHSLFKTGTFYNRTEEGVFEGNVNELEGKLNFIDQVDLHNRLRQKPPLDPSYQTAKHNHNTSALFSGRERTFSRFLYYRYFYGNNQPTVICEGKTDNVYIKSAVNRLHSTYPKLATTDPKTGNYRLLIKLFNYSKRTRFLLELYGGTSYLGQFIFKYNDRFNFYSAPKPSDPVIILLDNDSGAKDILGKISKIKSTTVYPVSLARDAYRDSDFIHVMHNLYIVFTPQIKSGGTEIEDFFDKTTLSQSVGGKSFNPKKDFDKTKEYGKEIFASKVVKPNKNSIDFDGFKQILERITQAIDHYHAVK